MRTKAWMRAGVAATLLVGVAGCGDDDDGGGVGLGGITDQRAEDDVGDVDDDDVAGGTTLELCSLLESSEIEAEFGERGGVSEGYEDFTSCVWDVGDQFASGSGNITVSDYGPAIGESMADYFAGFKELAENPVDLDGLGDEAYYEHDPTAFDDRSLDVVFEQSFVYFRADDVFLSVSAFFGPGVDGVQEKLVTLAEQVLDRL